MLLPRSADLASSLSGLPRPGERRLPLRVAPQAERALREGHPWLYDSSIVEPVEGSVGDLAVVFDRKRRFLAIGLFDPSSPIRMRVLHAGEPVRIDGEWFQSKLEDASALRGEIPGPADRTTDGYRLVNGESDGLPGLVVDRYADTLVAKLYTPAWIPHLQEVLPALLSVQPARRLVLRLNRAMQGRPELLHGLRDGQILYGPALDGPVVFLENGLRFEADPVGGQKTGFFLDQRDNRSRVEALCKGRDVLNVFCYTGGFSVYAARGGARSVVSVDASTPAVEAVGRNFDLNRTDRNVASCRHEPVDRDAFEALSDMARAGRRFDLVILDPPMFAQSKSQVDAALAAYRRLTRLGLSVLERGGTLVQASCSNRVLAEEFFSAVEDEARDSGRPLRDIRLTAHAVDHPVKFSGGAYLKCLFATA